MRYTFLVVTLLALTSAGALGVASTSAAAGSVSSAPKTLDSLVSLPIQRAELTADLRTAADELGFSVAIDGDTAVVGARHSDVGPNANAGAAYIFVRSGASWIQQARLTAPAPYGEAEDAFGHSVAIDGDSVVIGAPYADSHASDAGAAYVFVRSGTSWDFQDRLTSPDGASNDAFGFSVALCGDTALIGATGARPESLSYAGAVYVFTRSGLSWIQQTPRLTADDGSASDYFGYSVALSGDTALISATGDDSAKGSAYVFTASGSSWTQRCKLTAEADGAAGDYFGYSLALSGSTALIGAYSENVSGNEDRGAAYVFTGSGSSWNRQQKLTATGGNAYSYFGCSVAVDGDIAVVGAFQGDDVYLNQGSAYVFTRVATNWTQQTPKLTASEAAETDWFGYSVALSGGSAIIGAPLHDVGSAADAGAAYLFLVSDTIAPTTTAVVAPAPNVAGWNTAPVTVTLLADDGSGSGIAQTYYTLDGGGQQTYSGSFGVSGEGSHTISYWSTDGVGNVETTRSVLIKIDGSAPVTTIGGLPATTWVNKAVSLTFAASPAGLAPVARSDYSINGGTSWSACPSPLVISTPGITTLLYRSVSAAGINEAPKSATIRIDVRKPTSSAGKNVTVIKGRKAALPFKVTDPLPSCGKAKVVITIKRKAKIVKTIKLSNVLLNKARSYTFRVKLARGTYAWSVKATDIAGNVGKVSAAKKLTVR